MVWKGRNVLKAYLKANVLPILLLTKVNIIINFS